MNETEEKAFSITRDFYQKWREVIIETDDQWKAFAEDVGRMGRILDIDHNQLGWNLMYAVVETFNHLYKDGKKPLPADYFGRDDLST